MYSRVIFPKKNISSISQANPPVLYYVLSACSYAGCGLVALLSPGTLRCREFTPNDGLLPITDFLCYGFRNCRIVVWLSDTPLEMLTTLQALARLCHLSPVPLSVLILSPVRADWLYRTLSGMTGGCGPISGLRILPAKMSVQNIDRQIMCWERIPLFSSQARRLENNYPDKLESLSAREVIVMIGTLQGESIAILCEQLGLSNKTLYSIRSSGLRRLTKIFPSLNHLLPRSKRSKYSALLSAEP